MADRERVGREPMALHQVVGRHLHQVVGAVRFEIAGEGCARSTDGLKVRLGGALCVTRLPPMGIDRLAWGALKAAPKVALQGFTQVAPQDGPKVSSFHPVSHGLLPSLSERLIQQRGLVLRRSKVPRAKADGYLSSNTSGQPAAVVEDAFLARDVGGLWECLTQARALRSGRGQKSPANNSLEVPWLGNLDSNQDCPSQSREFYR